MADSDLKSGTFTGLLSSQLETSPVANLPARKCDISELIMWQISDFKICKFASLQSGKLETSQVANVHKFATLTEKFLQVYKVANVQRAGGKFVSPQSGRF